jgi:hypothetical protein
MSAYTWVVGTRVMTALLTGLTVLVSVAFIGPRAYAGGDYSGFFSQGELSRAGWSTCAPVTWSVDITGMTSKQARGEIKSLKRAWRAWSEASGLSVQYVGREQLAFDAATNGLRPRVGSVRDDHHVYVAFKAQRQVPIMAANAVGLAMPTAAVYATQELTGGMAIFRRGYVQEQRRLSPSRIQSLYLHELGHVLGLGHSASDSDVMYSALTDRGALGEGDRAGIRSFTHTCSAA